MSRVVLLVVPLLLAGSGWGVMEMLSAGTPVDVTAVSTGEIRTYVEERAKTRLPDVARITMPLAGRILPIKFEEGQTVEAGQEVARLDPADLDTELAEALASVGQYENLVVSVGETVKSAQAQVASSEAKARWAEAEFKRRSTLAEKNALSETERSSSELMQIQSRIDAQKDSLTANAYNAMMAYVQIGREDAIEKQKRKKRDRDRAVLKTPVGGTVLRRHESSERYLPAGEVLLEIGRLDDLEIEAEILTQDALQIREGADVEIEGVALGEKALRGTVARIYPRGFTKVSSLGVEQQRVLVIVRFDPDDRAALEKNGTKLGVDYRVRVRIFTDHRDSAVKVSRSALFRGPAGNWQAFVVRDGHARIVDLKLGLTNDFEAEVVEGLKAGDQVVIAPESSLTDGAKVEPHARGGT